jgi:hypothetical protein
MRASAQRVSQETGDVAAPDCDVPRPPARPNLDQSTVIFPTGLVFFTKNDVDAIAEATRQAMWAWEPEHDS